MAKRDEKFSIKKRAKSFGYAFSGLQVLISEEHNARIHLVVSILVVTLGFYLNISSLEWVALILCIGFVFVLEIINSSIENIADFIEPQRNQDIKKIKDLAAAAVLLGSFTAVIIGLVIFVPKLVQF